MKQSIVRWYVAKIKPRTENQIKAYLDKSGTNYFLPLKTAGQALLPGMIFICSDIETALKLPEESGLTLDFQYDPLTHQLQVIPDRQMADFCFLHTHFEGLTVLPEPEKLTGGEKVRVIGGEYAGIEGEIYRIKGHKRVVVRLGRDLAVAAGSYIAKENLEKIQELKN